MKVIVQPGDTLLALTRDALRGAGRPVPEGFKQLMATARSIAEANQIQDPDRIYPGQVIDFRPLAGAALEAGAAPIPRMASVVLDPSRSAGHRLLERMLDRAVAKGYLPRNDQPAVQRRILDMARQHRFAPDDFARVALMESDGLNPRATNGNCHGVIQFCSGPDRGAASVGYARQPERILQLSVLEQLELVDRYFEDTALGQFKPASLDTLYLTVLFPAAREERQMHTPLPIPGPQARALYVGGNREGPITRASLRKGLIENAAVRLTEFAKGSGNVLPISTGTWLASRRVN